jgi:hypothetical protein
MRQAGQAAYTRGVHTAFREENFEEGSPDRAMCTQVINTKTDLRERCHIWTRFFWLKTGTWQ